MEELKPAEIVRFVQNLRAEARCQDFNFGRSLLSKQLYRAADIIEEFNRRPAPENKPLTLEQLRQMDGEPVAVVEVEDKEYEYGLVSLCGNCFTKNEVVTLSNGNFYLFDDIGGNVKIYPYARKPEQEEQP